MAVKKEPAAPAAEEKPKSGKLKWLLVAVAVLLALGGGGGAYWFLLGPGSVAKDMQAEGLEQPGDPSAATTAAFSPEVVTLPAFIVNLADPLGRRFLRLTLDVEVVGSAAAEDLRKFDSRIRDAIILLLSSKAFTDLASMESKITLKNEIVERINQIVGAGKVSNVYFTEFVIQ